jgi:hypothetical protein
MKTVFRKKNEGLKLNSELDFATTEDIIVEFHYLVDTTESLWKIDFKYFYRLTDDNFNQIDSSIEGTELEICAPFKMRFQNLIEAHLPYKGYPVFKNSTVCTNEEFDGIIPHMKDQKPAIVEQAKANQTPIIKFLKEQGFNPRQT